MINAIIAVAGCTLWHLPSRSRAEQYSSLTHKCRGAAPTSDGVADVEAPGPGGRSPHKRAWAAKMAWACRKHSVTRRLSRDRLRQLDGDRGGPLAIGHPTAISESGSTCCNVLVTIETSLSRPGTRRRNPTPRARVATFRRRSRRLSRDRSPDDDSSTRKHMLHECGDRSGCLAIGAIAQAKIMRCVNPAVESAASRSGTRRRDATIRRRSKPLRVRTPDDEITTQEHGLQQPGAIGHPMTIVAEIRRRSRRTARRSWRK